MKKTLLKIFMLLLFSSGYSQKNIWEKTTESEVSTHLKVTRNSMPTAFQLYKLNLSDLKEKLVPGMDCRLSCFLTKTTFFLG